MRIQQASYTTFEAMKPNQFKGFDYACVRKFKAPVEKFETEKNFYGWAMDKLNVFVKEKLVEGKSDLTVTRRKEGIFEWRTELGFDLEAAPLALIVLSSILKDLKPNNDKLFLFLLFLYCNYNEPNENILYWSVPVTFRLPEAIYLLFFHYR